MYKYIVVALFFIPSMLFAQSVIPQKDAKVDTVGKTDLIDIAKGIFHVKPGAPPPDNKKHIYFSVLPVSGAAPGGTGRALVTSTTAGVYLGPKNTTNLSSVSFAPYWNFHSRFGLPLRSSIWLPDNTWNIQGDIRFLVYPQYTWGLGSSHSSSEKTLVDYRYIRFYQSALKRITPYFFAGVGYNLDYHSNIKSDDPNVDLKQYTGYQYGTAGSSLSSGISLNALYDTRNNSINPLPGAYANFVYRVNPGFLGSNDSWHSVYIDMRKYIPLNPTNKSQQNTLAIWTYYWTVLNSKAPYLDLPSVGWDPYNRSGRGMDQNRYRGRSLFYLEGEYRRDITENGLLGFVVFANANTVSGSGTIFTSWHPAAGTGLRIKFNKGSNTNVGIDYGFSKGYNSISVGLGEAF